MHIGDVFLGQQGGGAQLNLGSGHQLVRIRFRHLAALERIYGAIEHLAIEIEADFLNLAGLAFAEQLARAANLQVVGGERETGAEIAERRERVQAFFGIRRHRLARRRKQIGIGAMVRAPDTPAQLMQLGEAERIRPVDDDGVRARHVDAGLHDRGAQQHVEATMIEIQHHVFEFALVHLPVGNTNPRLGQQFGQVGGLALDILDLVMQVIDLAPAAHFSPHGLLDQHAVVARHEGLDRQARFGRRGNDRQIAQAGQAHVERARDRRGR